MFAGAGNDSMQWDPGDGSDVLEGQEHRDRLTFNGSAIGESVDLSADGQRLLLTRNIGSVVMDVDGIEIVDHRALGGADVTTVHDLAGTAVTDVNERLAGTLGGTTGDAAADQLIVNATNGADTPAIAPGGGGARVNGLAARTTVTTGESADLLRVNGLGGNDVAQVTPNVAPLIGVLFDGGAENDTVHARGTVGDDDLTATANGTQVAVSGDGATRVQPHRGEPRGRRPPRRRQLLRAPATWPR